MSLTAILTPILTIIGSIIGALVGTIIGVLVVLAVLFCFKSFEITKGFYAKLIRMTAKYFYIANVLLDFGLIVLAECMRMYGLKHSLVEWLSLFIGILAFGVLVNALLWSYYFFSKKIPEFYYFLSEKLFDLKLSLKTLKFRIQWKIRKKLFDLKWKIRNLFGK